MDNRPDTARTESVEETSLPILDVTLVADHEASIPGDLASRIADRAGTVFGAARGTTWVRLRHIPTNHYAENGGGPDPGVRPVFVTVLKAHVPQADALRAEIEQLTEAIAQACGRPAENVHVLYEPGASGRIAFGGNLLAVLLTLGAALFR